jgi:hypothetical protein
LFVWVSVGPFVDCFEVIGRVVRNRSMNSSPGSVITFRRCGVAVVAR